MESTSLKEAIFQACLKAAYAMKGDLKTLSWFGRNQKHDLCETDLQKAA